MSDTTATPEVPTNPKAALIRKAVILGGATLGILIATGVRLPKVDVSTDGEVQVGGDSEE